VFGDDVARQGLNAITHPRIALLSQQEIARHGAAGESVVLYEAALIVENRLDEWMAGLIVVSIPDDLQLSRLMTRDGLSEQAARDRIASQLPLADKCAVATHVIDNSGDLDQTRERVEQVWKELVG
jgi:dephospho-CoA kinase